jgi:DNA-binding MarR family transcriptional regulator
MNERIDEKRLDAWRGFLQAHAVVINELEDELMAEKKLPLAWYEVLLRLSWAPEGTMRMNELAESVILSRSGLTRLVDRMVDAGLVERAECPSDRRGKLAVITAAGRRTLRSASPVHMRGVARHFTDHISESDARTLRRVFERILAPADQKAEAS